ncbi:hypothetical protein P8452_61571 [Trifolium repens]|nr:hypothetical protein P8452_61571 [Trifolium repens]
MIDRTFGQFVRVLVDMDLSQTLRDKVLVERKGFAFFVEIDYENLPQFCSNCKLIGHHVGVCKRLNLVVEDNTEARDKRKPVKETNRIYVPKNDGRVEKKNDNEVINVESDKVEPLEPVNLSISGEVNSKKNDVNSLLNASGGSKSGTAQPHQPMSQNNRFAILDSNHDEGSISKQPAPSNPNPNVNVKGIVSRFDPAAVFNEQDQLLEFELNDESSSQGSFVDATQEQQDKSSSSESDKLDITPDRVKKDMAFLKDSWANMIENEEEEARLLTHLEQEPAQHVDNFQLKMSKSQKKTQKRMNQSSKDSYATRSKVFQKPFK